MYFPWVGMHEQMRLADDYVDYSDVAFSKGSFTNRVQIKTARGTQWLTLPLKNAKLGQTIAELRVNEPQSWRTQHRRTLAQTYARAPFLKEMLALVDEVLDSTTDELAQIARRSMLVVHRYFGFGNPQRWHSSAELGIRGAGSQRVLDIVKALGGTRYVTGLGALNYLDHERFDQSGIAVEYMSYQKRAYPQAHPPFTPYVSALDLVANVGRDGRDFIVSGTAPWRTVLASQPAT
jgi:hypothetical protein